MNAKLTLARPRVITTIAAAALSTVIAIGLLTAVTGLFERDGAPFEQVVIAEHAFMQNLRRGHYERGVETVGDHAGADTRGGAAMTDTTYYAQKLKDLPTVSPTGVALNLFQLC